MINMSRQKYAIEDISEEMSEETEKISEECQKKRPGILKQVITKITYKKQ